MRFLEKLAFGAALSVLIGYKMFLSATSGRPRSVTDFCFPLDKSLVTNPVSSDSNSIIYIKHMKDTMKIKCVWNYLNSGRRKGDDAPTSENHWLTKREHLMKNHFDIIHLPMLCIDIHTRIRTQYLQISLSSFSIIADFDPLAINRRFARPFVRSSAESGKSIRASVELKACTAPSPLQ